MCVVLTTYHLLLMFLLGSVPAVGGDVHFGANSTMAGIQLTASGQPHLVEPANVTVQQYVDSLVEEISTTRGVIAAYERKLSLLEALRTAVLSSRRLPSAAADGPAGSTSGHWLASSATSVTRSEQALLSDRKLLQHPPSRHKSSLFNNHFIARYVVQDHGGAASASQPELAQQDGRVAIDAPDFALSTLMPPSNTHAGSEAASSLASMFFMPLTRTVGIPPSLDGRPFQRPQATLARVYADGSVRVTSGTASVQVHVLGWDAEPHQQLMESGLVGFKGMRIVKAACIPAAGYTAPPAIVAVAAAAAPSLPSASATDSHALALFFDVLICLNGAPIVSSQTGKCPISESAVDASNDGPNDARSRSPFNCGYHAFLTLRNSTLLPPALLSSATLDGSSITALYVINGVNDALENGNVLIGTSSGQVIALHSNASVLDSVDSLPASLSAALAARSEVDGHGIGATAQSHRTISAVIARGTVLAIASGSQVHIRIGSRGRYVSGICEAGVDGEDAERAATHRVVSIAIDHAASNMVWVATVGGDVLVFSLTPLQSQVFGMGRRRSRGFADGDDVDFTRMRPVQRFTLDGHDTAFDMNSGGAGQLRLHPVKGHIIATDCDTLTVLASNSTGGRFMYSHPLVSSPSSAAEAAGHGSLGDDTAGIVAAACSPDAHVAVLTPDPKKLKHPAMQRRNVHKGNGASQELHQTLFAIASVESGVRYRSHKEPAGSGDGTATGRASASVVTVYDCLLKPAEVDPFESHSGTDFMWIRTPLLILGIVGFIAYNAQKKSGLWGSSSDVDDVDGAGGGRRGLNRLADHRSNGWWKAVMNVVGFGAAAFARGPIGLALRSQIAHRFRNRNGSDADDADADDYRRYDGRIGDEDDADVVAGWRATGLGGGFPQPKTSKPAQSRNARRRGHQHNARGEDYDGMGDHDFSIDEGRMTDADVEAMLRRMQRAQQRGRDAGITGRELPPHAGTGSAGSTAAAGLGPGAENDHHDDDGAGHESFENQAVRAAVRTYQQSHRMEAFRSSPDGEYDGAADLFGADGDGADDGDDGDMDEEALNALVRSADGHLASRISGLSGSSGLGRSEARQQRRFAYEGSRRPVDSDSSEGEDDDADGAGDGDNRGLRQRRTVAFAVGTEGDGAAASQDHCEVQDHRRTGAPLAHQHYYQEGYASDGTSDSDDM